MEITDIRVGQGYDVHRLKEGRPMVLGGVQIESRFGPDGHSDADVLLHAICDALLGALSLGDIGRHFSNKDDRWKGISSLTLLEICYKMVAERGYRVLNVDANLVLEEPKIARHAQAMQQNISAVLGIDAERISIKATTGEGIGFTGRKEGVAAMATLLLVK